jgi:dienelactone hydrolase
MLSSSMMTLGSDLRRMARAASTVSDRIMKRNLSRGLPLIAIAIASTLLSPTAARAAAPPTTRVSASRSATIALPALPGRYQVGTVTQELIDPTRLDPFAPVKQNRALMVQLWYPATQVRDAPYAPYMPPATAAYEENESGLPAGILATIGTHAQVRVPVIHRPGGWPVVLFSPGSGTSRTLYTTLVEDLASQGFVVVAIDHPYDADVVEFPGGRLVLGDLPPDSVDTNTFAVQVRAQDTNFVVNQLAAFDAGDFGSTLRGTLDLRRIGMFGHSMGGATAAAAMLTDRRITAGVDLDGTFYGPVLQAGLDRPFLLMSSGLHDRTSDDTWAQLWSHLRGWHRDLKLDGSGHLSYSDVGVLADPLHLRGLYPPEELPYALGTIDGVRAADIEQTYLTAYFDHFLLHRPEPLIEHPDPRYPEVLFQN